MQRVRETEGPSGPQGTPWGPVWPGLAVALAGSAVLGTVLVVVTGNVWWLALASTVSLFVGGLLTGLRARELEPLYGAVVGAIVVGLGIIGILVGSTFAVLPDPLPGLPIGDSTFFFVSPLVMVIGGIAGSIVGGRIATGRQGKTLHQGRSESQS